MALLGASSHASACPAICETLRTFGSGAVVPGNQVYFKVLVDDPGPLSLKSADGKAIPASVRMIGPDLMYAPIDPIPSDSVVVLTYTNNACGIDQKPINYVFQTRAPLDLQLRDAPISNGEYGLVGADLDQFQPPITSLAFQRVNYGSPDAAGAVSHLLDVELKVDGQQFLFPYPNNFAFPIEVHAVCFATDPFPREISTCYEPIYGSGHHTITVQPHIVGYADPPPSSLDIDFDRACGVRAATGARAAVDAGTNTPPPAASDACPKAPPPAATDAGASSNAGSLAPAQAGAAPPSASSPGANMPSSSGGCSTTAGRDGSASAWLVMLALACLRRRERR